MKDKLYILTTLTGCAAFISVASYISKFDGQWSTMTMLFFSFLIPLFPLVFRKKSLLSFLFTTFVTVIVVRNAGQHDWLLIGWVTSITFIPLLIQLIGILTTGLKQYGPGEIALSFIRMFLGYNWLTHCTEKLFVSQHDTGLVGFFKTVAGPHLFGTVLTDQFAVYLIILAGLVEFTSAVSMGLGILSRFGAFTAAVYLISAELLGGHFSVGYTWMMPGGGWETCFYYFMVTIPFILPKTGGPISLDNEWNMAKTPFAKLAGY